MPLSANPFGSPAVRLPADPWLCAPSLAEWVALSRIVASCSVVGHRPARWSGAGLVPFNYIGTSGVGD